LMLYDVLPSLTTTNIANVGASDTVPLRQHSSRRLRFSTNRAHVIVGKFVLRIRLAWLPAWYAVSTLVHHVSHVVSVAAEKQVLWSNARPIVAAMKHVQAVRYVAVMDHPTCAVRVKQLTKSTVCPDLAVSCRREASSPDPALSGRIDFCPKALDQCASLTGHVLSLLHRLRGAMRPAASTARARLIASILPSTSQKRQAVTA